MKKPETNCFFTDTMLNLAHRGANRVAPENTLPAFRAAAELGADGVELDVQLSKDGEVVIIHDFSVDKTTDGSGLVCSKTLAQLKTLDAGSRFSAEFAATPIPTLQEVFTALGPVLLFNIELKTTGLTGNNLEAEVIRLVEDFALQDRVLLSSFNPFALRRAAAVNPRIKRGLLLNQKSSFLTRFMAMKIAAPHALHPHRCMVSAQLVAREQSFGRPVNVWTCNEPAEMRRLIRAGVNAIITDQPDILKQVLNDPAP